MNIFDLVASISLDSSKFSESLTSARGVGDKFTSTMSSGFKTVASAAAIVTGAAVAAGGAIVGIGKSTADAGDRIDKMSQQLGMSRQGFQEWDFILSQNGVSIDSMKTGMKSLTKSIDDLTTGSGAGVESFAQLGISMDDIKGKSQEEIFEMTVKELQKMPEGFEKARLAQELFGKQGQEMLPMLNQSKGSIDDLKAKAHELGMVMGDEAVDSAVKFTDALDQAKRMLGGFKNKIGAEILPAMTGVLDAFMAMATGADGAQEKLDSAVSGIITLLTDMIPKLLEVGIQIVTSLVTGLATALPDLVTAVTDMIPFIVGAIVELLPIIMDAGIQIILAFIVGIASALPELLPVLAEAMITMVTTIIDSIPLIIDAGMQVFSSLLDSIDVIIATLVPMLPTLINGLVTGLIKLIPVIINAGIELLGALLDALPEILAILMPQIPLIIFQLVNAIIQLLPVIIDAGIQVFSALLKATPQIIGMLIPYIPIIIMGLVGALLANIPQIIMAGVQVLTSLITNLPQIIATIITAIPVIIAEIVNGFINAVPQMISVGGDMVRGIWSGISGAGGWLMSQISGFADGIVSGVKGFFGIKSPSRRFRDEVGKDITRGIGVGVEAEAETAVSAIASVGKKMFAKSKEFKTDFTTDFGVNDYDIVDSKDSGAGSKDGITVVQHISAKPMTAQELLEETLAGFKRMKWEV